MTPLRTFRLAAAAVLAASVLAVLPAAPAAAATCSSASGVSVVVDFSLLGGSVAATCVAGGGGDTAGAIAEVDHDLTRVAQFPGAVCRVDGTPADAPCQRMPPADAYWGLFWSDGSGGWVYSSQGVDSLDIPDGGSVAFAWQDGGDRDEPGIAPPQHASEEPSSSTSPDGDGNGGNGGDDGSGDQGGQPASSTAPSASPTAPATASDAPDQDQGDRGDQDGKRDKGDKGNRDGEDDEASATPEADPSDAVPTGAEPPADSGDGSLPTWVAPAGIAGLFGVAGVVALLRRRSTG